MSNHHMGGEGQIQQGGRQDEGSKVERRMDTGWEVWNALTILRSTSLIASVSRLFRSPNLATPVGLYPQGGYHRM